MTDALCFLTVAESAERIERKELSPVTLTQAFLNRIERVNPKVNAYVTVTPERAMEDARRAEAEINSGHYKGALHGIPVGLKDIYDTKGIRTTCHSNLLLDRIPEEDAFAVKRLKDAGSVLLGKLATHEFAFAGPAWDAAFPPARNPWNTDHFTGGSSSGSGAAIAAGLAMATLGTDTAGSIRMPAYFCGVSGLKPTYGRVSRQGVFPLAFSMDHCGPITRTAQDAAIVMNTIAGHDENDPASAMVDVPDYRATLGGDISGLKVGLIRHFYEHDEAADSNVVDAMNTSVALLEELGAEIQDVQLPNLHDFSACCQIIIMCEALGIHEDTVKAHPKKYSEIARDRLMLGSVLTGADYVQATRMRRELTNKVNEVLQKFDVLLTAGGLTLAPRLEQIDKFYILQKPLVTTPFDVTGHPAIAVCNGFSENGLPVGMQVIGRAFDEAMVMRVAHAYESATDWTDRVPNLG
ncbi:amidase [Ruegeria arenilitoris]|uniref:amidase n=1 Tax=Ruegeria arenilitoris TaxID=1173585 RepID=UPI00147D0A11|nr:amidase [Ruegeria arenilitoris]